MPGPYDPYTPTPTPFPASSADALERLARQLVVRQGMGGKIIRTPEIPGFNIRELRPFLPMYTTDPGMGRPVIDIAGRDPLTWNAAKGTASQINERLAANQAARAERMAAYQATRPVTPPPVNTAGRPLISVAGNAGRIIGRMLGGGPKIMGR